MKSNFMNINLNIVKNNVLGFISKKNIFQVSILFILVNLITLSSYEINTFNELLNLSFYGVPKISELPIEFLKWSAIQFFILYIILKLFYTEVYEKLHMTLLRVSDKKTFINSLLVSMFCICILYYLIGFLVLISFNLKLLFTTINSIYLFKIFLLYILFSYTFSLIGILMFFFIKNENLVFTLIFFFTIISTSIEGNINKYLLISQGMLIKHISYNFNYVFSITLILVFLVITFYGIKSLFMGRDIY